MINEPTPIKQILLSEPISPDAIKLARAIYNTYLLEEHEEEMELKIETILHLLKIEEIPDPLKYIQGLLEELNEPLGVKDFVYEHKIYPLRFVFFCKYSIEDGIIQLQLNPEYIHVQKNYMEDHFL